MLLGLLLLLMVTISSQSTNTCSESCDCKWKDGKQTVDCSNKALTTLPDKIDPGTQVLILNGNSIRLLAQKKFFLLGLTNLQRIFLSKCRITQIDDRAFYGLTNLIELDFSDNLLRAIPSKTFEHYKSLMRLILKGNPIEEVKDNAFKDLQFLTYLALDFCKIHTIESRAFKGLHNLEWLKLNGNQIKTMNGGTLLPKSLHGLDVHDNPWLCDCKLRELRTWLTQYNIPMTVEPRCQEPQRLLNQSIRAVQLTEFACVPEISPSTMFLDITEERNVSFICKVYAVPEATIAWYFKKEKVHNNTIFMPDNHLYYIFEEGSIQKNSELYIFHANRQDNGTFVCVAQNQAGSAFANFTIHVTVPPEPPVVKKAELPIKLMMIIGCALFGCIVIVLIMICCLISKCRSYNKRQNQNIRPSSNNGYKSNKGNSTGNVGTHMPISQSVVGINGSAVRTNHTLDEQRRMYPADMEVLTPPRNFADPDPDLITDTESKEKSVVKRSKSCDNPGTMATIQEFELERQDSYKEAMEHEIEEQEQVLSSMYGILGPKPYTPTKRRLRWSSQEELWRIPPRGAEDSPQYVSSIYDPSKINSYPRHSTPNHTQWETNDNQPNDLYNNDGYPKDFGLPRYPNGNLHIDRFVPEGGFYSAYTASTLPRNFGSYRSHSLPSSHNSSARSSQYSQYYGVGPSADLMNSYSDSYDVCSSDLGCTPRTIPEGTHSPKPPVYETSDTLGTVYEVSSETDTARTDSEFPPPPLGMDNKGFESDGQLIGFPPPPSDSIDSGAVNDEPFPPPPSEISKVPNSAALLDRTSEAQEHISVKDRARALESSYAPLRQFGATKVRVLPPHPAPIHESPDEGYEDEGREGTEV